MRRSRMWVIARHEWKATVLRREFLLMTVGLPLFIGLIVFLTTVVGTLAVAKAARNAGHGATAVGIYDQAHILSPAAYSAPIDGVTYRLVGSLQAGEQGVSNGSLKALLVVPSDYPKSGRTELYRKPAAGIFDNTNNWQYDNGLRAGLTKNLLPAAMVERVVHPEPGSGPIVYEWSSSRRLFTPAGAGSAVKEIAKFAIPYAFSMLLLVSIFTGTGYLLYGLVEEKENRVMEILLSSVSHEDLLRGKLIGLGAAGLTQLAVWALLGGVPAAIALSLAPSAPHIPPLTLVMAVVLFLLGFTLYGAIMAGVGSMGTSWRESQQATAGLTMCAVVPLMMMAVFMAEPNGVIARSLSWFPLTAPIGMMLRIGLGTVAWWDIAISIASLALGIWIVLKISAKLFRLGLLLYGKAPSAGEIWRWLVTA